jgi:hypothetical protein
MVSVEFDFEDSVCISVESIRSSNYVNVKFSFFKHGYTLQKEVCGDFIVIAKEVGFKTPEVIYYSVKNGRCYRQGGDVILMGELITQAWSHTEKRKLKIQLALSE